MLGLGEYDALWWMTQSSPTAVPRSLPTPSALTSGKDSTDGTSYATASIAPAANQPIYAVFAARRSVTKPVVTAAGNGLTWVEVARATIADIRVLYVFRAAGAAPSAGAVTFTCNQTCVGALWWVGQFTGADTSGTNGSGATVQSDIDDNITSGTTGNTTFASPLEHANNVNLTAVITALSTASVTPDAQFAELFDDAAAEFVGLEVQWARGESTCDPTWSTSAAAIISVEVKAA